MMTSKDTNTSAIDFKRKDAQKPAAVKTAEAILDTIKPTKPAEATKPVAIKTDSTREGYCIVLASHVNKQNAEIFINNLAERVVTKVPRFMCTTTLPVSFTVTTRIKPMLIPSYRR